MTLQHPGIIHEFSTCKITLVVTISDELWIDTQKAHTIPELPSLLHKIRRMFLIQSARIQDLSSRRPHEVNLQMLLVQKSNRTVAVVLVIRKPRIIGLTANRAQTLNITCTPSNNIHGCLGILHTVGVGGTIDNRQEPLRIVYMAKDTEVNAILVKQALERLLAGTADARRSTSCVPRSVSSDNYPGCDTPVDGSEIGLEEVDLLGGSAKWSAVQLGRTIWPTWCIREICFGVDHYDVGHAVFEGIPKGRQ